MVNMVNRDYRIIFDTECPVSRDANLVWLGFSEEGQLLSFDSEGVMRAFTFTSQQWSPIYDFKQRHPDVYTQIWIVAVMDYEILAIVMPVDAVAPSITQKSQIKSFKFKPTFLDQESNTESKELTQSQLESQIFAK